MIIILLPFVALAMIFVGAISIFAKGFDLNQDTRNNMDVTVEALLIIFGLILLVSSICLI